MISPVFYAALALVAADLGSDLSAVASNANNLNDKVKGWSSADGLPGALVIQENYPALSSAAGALKGSVGSASKSDVLGQVSGIGSLASAVQGLLDGLTSKAADFKAVSATSIVTQDINGLSSSTADIIKALAAAAGDEVPSDLAKAASDIAGAFSSAIDAFGATPVQFPNVSAGSGSGSESSAASSEAATSEAASSAAGSSAAATTEAASSAAGADATSVVEETVTETVCTHETCTEVTPANAAGRNTIFGGVAAIAAALL